MTNKIKEKAVVAGFHASWSCRVIAELNKLSSRFVYKMKRKLEMSERLEDDETNRRKPDPCSEKMQNTEVCGERVSDGK